MAETYLDAAALEVATAAIKDLLNEKAMIHPTRAEGRALAGRLAALAIRAYLAASGEAVAAGWISGEGAMKLAKGSPAVIDAKPDATYDVTIPLYAAPQPAQVAVKPLEWKLAWLGEDGVYARTPFGQTYFAYSDGRWEDTNTISHQAAPATMDAAKAAAQADFASCIAPVLTPSPADGAVEALRGAFITCLSDGQSGRYEVTAKFKTLRDAQEAHSAIIHALKGDTP